MDFLTYSFIFLLSMFLGIELIRKVPAQLHTPLMSGSNAISGISLIGAMTAVAIAGDSTVALILAGFAVAFGMINVVGGYLVTDRMLAMFKHKG
ncbi:MAG: NAD(P) transhydrogenase subunit alpha [Phycisphaeraceae bacterium]|nr:MAG: NAD(P) transhydrogenase subunit alpha [Phycisphaeraceae bacterium]